MNEERNRRLCQERNIEIRNLQVEIPNPQSSIVNPKSLIFRFTMTDVFIDSLEAAVAKWGLSLWPEQLALMHGHYRAMVDANRRTNLTRITGPSEAAVKHYADSLALLPWLNSVDTPGRTLLDVGTGAGFPSMPLAIAMKSWSVTAIDGTGRKVEFLTSTARELGVKNLTPLHARAEHWVTDRGFDIVVSRAIAPLSRYLRWVGGLVRPGGWIVAYKTANLDEAEECEATATARRLHLQPHPPFTYRLHLGDECLDRALYVYEKP